MLILPRPRTDDRGHEVQPAWLSFEGSYVLKHVRRDVSAPMSRSADIGEFEKVGYLADLKG